MYEDILKKDLSKINSDEVDVLVKEFSFLLLSNLYDVKDEDNLKKAIENKETNIISSKININNNDLILEIEDFEKFKESYKNNFMDLRLEKLNHIKEDNPELYTSLINSIENNLTDSLLILGKFKNLNTLLKNKAFNNLNFKNIED